MWGYRDLEFSTCANRERYRAIEIYRYRDIWVYLDIDIDAKVAKVTDFNSDIGIDTDMCRSRD